MTAPKRKQFGIRLSGTAVDHLETLRAHYGLSQTALVEFLLREHARLIAEKLAATPRLPCSTLVSAEVDEDEANEFRGLRASITRAELDR
jgi:hypothetical protein